MDLNKLGVMLCLAFQESEGPFELKVSYSNHDVWVILSKEEVKILSDQDDVKRIDICNPGKDRRWMKRLSPDRRR